MFLTIRKILKTPRTSPYEKMYYYKWVSYIFKNIKNGINRDHSDLYLKIPYVF